MLFLFTFSLMLNPAHATVGFEGLAERFANAAPAEFARTHARSGRCLSDDGQTQAVYLLAYVNDERPYALISARTAPSSDIHVETAELKAYASSLERAGIYRAFAVEAQNGEMVVLTPKGDKLIYRQITGQILVRIERPRRTEFCEFDAILF